MGAVSGFPAPARAVPRGAPHRWAGLGVVGRRGRRGGAGPALL